MLDVPPQITDAGLAVIAKLPQLAALEVCGGEITSAGLGLLTPLANTLTHLSVAQNPRCSLHTRQLLLPYSRT